MLRGLSPARITLSEWGQCSPSVTVCHVLPPGKKDAEGWETVQRGRPAKPRSAVIVAKVSPVVAHVAPKQDGSEDRQSRLQPLGEQQQPCPPCPQDKDGGWPDSEQPVPVEHVPLEEAGEAGDSEKGHMMEVLHPTPSPSDIYPPYPAVPRISIIHEEHSNIRLFYQPHCFCFGALWYS